MNDLAETAPAVGAGGSGPFDAPPASAGTGTALLPPPTLATPTADGSGPALPPPVIPTTTPTLPPPAAPAPLVAPSSDAPTAGAQAAMVDERPSALEAALNSAMSGDTTSVQESSPVEPAPAPTPSPAPEPADSGTLVTGEPLAAQMQPSIPDIAPAPPTAPAPPIGAVTALPDLRRMKVSKPNSRGGVGLLARFVKTLFTLAILGGLVAAAIVYGPELKEKYLDGTDDSAAVENRDAEVEAPLRFPPSPAEAPITRTATFTVEHPDAERTVTYEVTTDFETQVARVLIDREGLPNLEVMTFLEDAVIRRVDSEQWFKVSRGQFPLEDQLQRERWVRMLDELIPLPARGGAVITDAADTEVAGEPMRRLNVTIDGSSLAQPRSADAPPNPVTPTLAPDAELAVDGQLPISLGPNEILRGTGTIQLEMWVDRSGVIRRLIAPAEAGGEVVTVLEVSPEPWLPEYPAQDAVTPLTASGLVSLGL